MNKNYKSITKNPTQKKEDCCPCDDTMHSDKLETENSMNDKKINTKNSCC